MRDYAKKDLPAAKETDENAGRGCIGLHGNQGKGQNRYLKVPLKEIINWEKRYT